MRLLILLLLLVLVNSVLSISETQNHEITIHSQSKFCFVENFYQGVHQIIKFMLGNSENELMVYDRSKTIVFFRQKSPHYMYAHTASVGQIYFLICIQNNSMQPTQLKLEVRRGVNAGDQQMVFDKEKKQPIEKAVNKVEQIVNKVIQNVEQDDKIVVGYRNYKQDIKQVSIIYGLLTVSAILMAGCVQVFFLQQLFIKKKLI